MHLVLLGPPGAGKGTQASKLEAKYQVPHIATGDMFRRAIKQETELGKKAKKYMDQGQLVPDEVTIGIVRERLSEADCQDGFILDGFPRTINQAESLTEILNDLDLDLDAVFNIEVSNEEVINRLSARRVCSECGATYHLEYDPPAEEKICDECGGEIYQRDDDTPDTIQERLEVYHDQTAPVVDYYRNHCSLKIVDGEHRPEIVFERMVEIIERLG